ncbi:mechanosensitive ion channel family protein [Histidinibacterium aquaticum]|uniref:Small-conductance mechanosensitive channel n=1 Tax=Histidinibacterium aquaticum TaxID=2613962 RepID=A0A5J5GNW7_9RHOB|nr:mechanosensitive ion channel family protein [Histidinibacterium aquaticum]KAA9010076.1 mechanosensitive ion channel [Histidinibacterium aquaticum]
MSLLRLLIVLLLLAPPLGAQDTGPDGPIAAVSDGVTDAAVERRIREILAELGGYEDVTVSVAEGIVTLQGTTTSAPEVTSLGELAQRVEGVVAVKNEVTETADIARRLNPAMDRFRTRVESVLIALPLVLIAAAIFAVIVGIGFALARLRRPWDRIAPNAFIADVYRAVIRVVFVIVGLVVALDVLNATALLSTILGAAGIIGLAVGFAVRDTVENFIASIMLSIRQPFGPNDVVEINGDQGKVIRLTSRATILLNFDGNQIRIPNATVFKSRIVNFSANPEMRFMLTIGVDLMSDLAEAKRLALQTVQGLPFTLESPAPMVWLGEITDSGVEVVATGWIDQRENSLLLARSEALRQVKRAFAAAGIEMPNTTYTIVQAGESAPAAPAPSAESEPATLDAVAETASEDLDAIVDAERNQRTSRDLLREDARKE